MIVPISNTVALSSLRRRLFRSVDSGKGLCPANWGQKNLFSLDGRIMGGGENP